MFLGQYEPMIPGRTLDDPKADFRTADKIGPYRLSREAFYLPNRSYLLRCDIQNAICARGATLATGCCAGGIPVSCILIDAKFKKLQFTCDSEAIAARVVDALNDKSTD